MAVISSQVLLCDSAWIYEHIYTLSERIYDICALATAALTVYFIPFLVPSVKWSSSFPTWVVFLSSRPPLACPRGWVKADKTPKYSVKHGRPLPRGRSLQCLLGNYGNNSAVKRRGQKPREDEVRPVSLRREEWWRWTRGSGVKVKRVGSRARRAHKPLLSHQRLLDVCGHSLWSVLLNNQDADERWWQVFE